MWLGLTFAVMILGGIAAALIQRLIQNRDYKRQIDGKIPMREAKKGFQPQKETVNIELEAERARQDAINAGNIGIGR